MSSLEAKANEPLGKVQSKTSLEQRLDEWLDPFLYDCEVMTSFDAQDLKEMINSEIKERLEDAEKEIQKLIEQRNIESRFAEKQLQKIDRIRSLIKKFPNYYLDDYLDRIYNPDEIQKWLESLEKELKT
jgi:DNA repair ATPase RecN